MRNIYCIKCGVIVLQLAVGSKIRKGTECTCKKCQAKEFDIPDFLRDIMRRG